VQRRDRLERRHLGWREVAHADRPNLALLEQAAEHPGRLLDGHQGIRPVDVIHVDAIRPQPLERVLHFPPNPPGRCVAEHLTVSPFEAGLRRDQDTIAGAALGDGLADELLGPAEPVGRRRVDQRDAEVERRPDGANRLGLVRTAPHPATNCPGT
jgi:hypothetical protein